MEKDPDVLHSVPDSLQRLVRFTVRGFYGIEHGLAMDVLVRNACVKEEDIQELLKFDRKQLRIVLNQLKNDKFLKSRPYVETQPDGKVSRHNYFFINYRSVANVIKYKLHQMHKRIETRERDSSNRPSFKCPTCGNTYGDLEVKQLIDPMFGTLNCTFCKSEVVEDKETGANQDARTLQARFNEQTEPLYKLLKDVENVNLANDLLEPKPTVIPHLHPNVNRAGRPHKTKTEAHWAQRSTSNIDYQQKVVINMDGDANDNGDQAKEVPQWMSESTVGGGVAAHTSSSKHPVTGGDGGGEDTVDLTDQSSSAPIDDEVLQTLLVQERSGAKPPPHHHDNQLRRYDDNKPTTTTHDEDSDEFDDDDVVVMVDGTAYTYEEVATSGDDLIRRMTPAEKDKYIEIAQNMYEDMHE